jgi:1,4-dihydroxy-2-naphthoate octaprenyltransferase
MAKIGCWIEAMRLRTLPVSVAGVIAAAAFALMNNKFEATPVLLCLSFAILAQIASNFANEYFDFKAGLDKPGRVGPRRGVTEGDITPKAMKNATYGTLALACLIGLSLVHWGGFWLIAVGLAIAVGVLAYSAGPYPLSQHALGEVAVLFFFGIIPVNFTYYLQAGAFDLLVFYGSIGIGLMGANVLIVNNYRDLEADQDVDKYTLAVAIGRHRIAGIYLINGWLAVALMMPAWTQYEPWKMIVPVIYVVLHSLAHNAIIKRRGTALNPMLGITAMLMLLYCLGFLLATAL